MNELGVCLECPICFQTLADPRILPCAHTFCMNCIDTICERTLVRCPLCRLLAPAPANGGKGFPANYLVASLLEKLLSSKVEDNTKHRKESVKMCSGRHSPMKVTLYCKTCSMMICHKCAYDRHPKGKHVCKPIDASAAECREKLASILKELERNTAEILSAKKKLEEEQVKWQESVYLSYARVNEFFTLLSNCIQNRRSSLLRSVENHNREKQQLFTHETENLSDTHHNIKKRLELIEAMTALEDSELITKMANFELKSIGTDTSQLSIPSGYLRIDVNEQQTIAAIEKLGSLHILKRGNGGDGGDGMDEVDIEYGLENSEDDENENENYQIDNNHNNNDDNSENNNEHYENNDVNGNENGNETDYGDSDEENYYNDDDEENNNNGDENGVHVENDETGGIIIYRWSDNEENENDENVENEEEEQEEDADEDGMEEEQEEEGGDGDEEGNEPEAEDEEENGEYENEEYGQENEGEEEEEGIRTYGSDEEIYYPAQDDEEEGPSENPNGDGENDEGENEGIQNEGIENEGHQEIYEDETVEMELEQGPANSTKPPRAYAGKFSHKPTHPRRKWDTQNYEPLRSKLILNHKF